MSDPSLPFTRVRDGVTVAVRVAPRAARQRIGEIADEANGGRVIKVSVTAPPEGGKANKALIRLLAKQLGVAPGAVTIVAGETQRRKRLRIAGESEALAARLGKISRDRA